MKTLFRSLSLVCITLILFSIGCRKKEDSRPVHSISFEEPSNPVNPYDDFGYLHNSILDYIQEKRIWNKSLNFDLSCESIRQYCQAKALPELASSYFDSIPQIVNDAATNIFLYRERSKLSDSTKNRLSQLLKRMEDLSFGTCNYPPIEENYCGI